jgi:hypothetical protein
VTLCRRALKACAAERRCHDQAALSKEATMRLGAIGALLAMLAGSAQASDPKAPRLFLVDDAWQAEPVAPSGDWIAADFAASLTAPSGFAQPPASYASYEATCPACGGCGCDECGPTLAAPCPCGCPPAEPPTNEELAAQLQALARQITVTTGSPKFRLLVGGALVCDALYNSARPVGPGTPFFLTPGSPLGFEQDTFDIHGRQTSLFAAVQGPWIGEYQSGGLVLVNLYNDAVIVDRYGLLPIQAFGELKNDYGRFAAGLQTDIFSPLLPTVLPFSYLVDSGNVGVYRGQVRCERFVHLDDLTQLTFTAGISDPVGTVVGTDLLITEDNGWPDVEGRIALGLGPAEQVGLAVQRPLEVGVSCVLGQIRNVTGPTRVVADVWGVAGDLHWAITDWYGVRGEWFTGQTLGSYGGGVMQSVNTATLAGVHSFGLWGEGYVYLTPCVHTHFGYAVDDPLDNDLTGGQIVRNETWFANVLWDVTSAWRLGLEITRRETHYRGVPDNDGVGIHGQAQWKF